MGKNTKEKRDVYNRLAKENNWRARSVFKLLQVDEEMHILDNAQNVVDLCAAPGSWSQALQKILSQKSSNYKIVAVDLQKIEPIPGVITLIGDITKESTALKIIEKFNGKLVDVVVCDGAADITGIHSLDESFHYFILTSAIAITSHLLRNGGHFVIKIFQGIHTKNVVKRLSNIFEEVRVIKPLSSRNASSEAFLIAKNYNAPMNFKSNLLHPSQLLLENSLNNQNEYQKLSDLLKFVICGSYGSNHINFDNLDLRDSIEENTLISQEQDNDKYVEKYKNKSLNNNENVVENLNFVTNLSRIKSYAMDIARKRNL